MEPSTEKELRGYIRCLNERVKELSRKNLQLAEKYHSLNDDYFRLKDNANDRIRRIKDYHTKVVEQAEANLQGVIEAQHEAVKRIEELEAEICRLKKQPETFKEPTRYDMIEVCKNPQLWLGHDVILDDEETLRYPWIDYRDKFRHTRVEEFTRWMATEYKQRDRARHRELYANNPEYRQRKLETNKQARVNKKKQCGKIL